MPARTVVVIFWCFMVFASVFLWANKLTLKWVFKKLKGTSAKPWEGIGPSRCVLPLAHFSVARRAPQEVAPLRAG
jgi:hypothetical protein